MPGVYISHNVSPWELAQVYVLAQETERQDFPAFIPDRNWDHAGPLPYHLRQLLRRADVILVFATLNGHYQEWVNKELASAANKRILVLTEQGIEFTGIQQRDIVKFDRSEDIGLAIQEVTEHVQQLHMQKSTGNLITGLVVGGLILLLLRGLGGKGDQG